MGNRAKEAVSRFMQGYNCAQAVSSVFAGDAGVPEEVVLCAVTGFGGGMGHAGGTCGAVSGGVLAIGLLFGSTGVDEKEAKDLTYALTREFIMRFVRKNGTVSCTELLGCDISTDEGLARSREQNLTRTLCPRYVRDAVEILEEVLASVTSGQSTMR
ncbi:MULTISPECIES: C-GCAxxG-C-C family protein [Methanoculleus]|uniref:C_GCAxxG_C_C family protein n=2 Tax=Methanoculleus TaxID=45989 RepID=A3CSR0_METMJ|nr:MULTISPECIES: C-GCAxxG-C-C family protein [Methanoculleus]ABN56410.1 C_GCAxxG_C_C family protein [Methanoculleus marisnigri JR1]MCC7556107.1 C-GCAxxG-C-C family protein [Methanoculleus marisnigri]UYU17857.1 C-GCAxxG-C-C family protein [Methanoculleus submarinus]